MIVIGFSPDLTCMIQMPKQQALIGLSRETESLTDVCIYRTLNKCFSHMRENSGSPSSTEAFLLVQVAVG